MRWMKDHTSIFVLLKSKPNIQCRAQRVIYLFTPNINCLHEGYGDEVSGMRYRG